MVSRARASRHSLGTLPHCSSQPLNLHRAASAAIADVFLQVAVSKAHQHTVLTLALCHPRFRYSTRTSRAQSHEMLYSLLPRGQQMRTYLAPHPRQKAPRLPCHTRFVPHDAQVSFLFKHAPQLEHECLRLPPDAVFSTGVPQTGQILWSCRFGLARTVDSRAE